MSIGQSLNATVTAWAISSTRRRTATGIPWPSPKSSWSSSLASPELLNVELVAIGVEHVDEVFAPLLDGACPASAQLHQPLDFRIDPASSFIVGRASRSADVQVEMDSILDGFLFGYPLKVDPRAHPIRIDHRATRIPLALGNPLRL